MKKLFFFLTSIAAIGQLSAQDPYKALGIKENEIEYLTLSKGRYDEFHGYNDYEAVGSSVIDMQTNKIVRFMDEDSVVDCAFLEFDNTTRFLTQDPLAEKYYQMSPYGYCLNNPITNIDPNGMEVTRDKDGNYHITGSDIEFLLAMSQSKVDNSTMNQALEKAAGNEKNGFHFDGAIDEVSVGLDNVPQKTNDQKYNDYLKGDFVDQTASGIATTLSLFIGIEAGAEEMIGSRLLSKEASSIAEKGAQSYKSVGAAAKGFSKAGKVFKGGSKAARDGDYLYSKGKDFVRWFHRVYEDSAAPNATKAEIDEAFDYWKSVGSPKSK